MGFRVFTALQSLLREWKCVHNANSSPLPGSCFNGSLMFAFNLNERMRHRLFHRLILLTTQQGPDRLRVFVTWCLVLWKEQMKFWFKGRDARTPCICAHRLLERHLPTSSVKFTFPFVCSEAMHDYQSSVMDYTIRRRSSQNSLIASSRNSSSSSYFVWTDPRFVHVFCERVWAPWEVRFFFNLKYLSHPLSLSISARNLFQKREMSLILTLTLRSLLSTAMVEV